MSAKWWTEHRVAFSLYSVTSRGQSVLWSHVSSRFDDLPTPSNLQVSLPHQSILSFCTFLLPSRTSHTGGCATNVEKFSVVTPLFSPNLNVQPEFSSVLLSGENNSRDTTVPREVRAYQPSVIPQQRPHQFLIRTFLHDSNSLTTIVATRIPNTKAKGKTCTRVLL